MDSDQLVEYGRETFETAPSRARCVVPLGDVLMPTERPNLRAPFLYRSQPQNLVCSTRFAVLRAKRDQCEHEFSAAHWFGHPIRSQLAGLLSKSNYSPANSNDVRRLQAMWPPTLEEQRTIAIFPICIDAQIAALQRRLDKTRAIKLGLMQQVLSGCIRFPLPDAPVKAGPDR